MQYYLDNVVRGDGSFVEIARTFHDYARAIKQKLLQELTPALSGDPNALRLAGRNIQTAENFAQTIAPGMRSGED